MEVACKSEQLSGLEKKNGRKWLISVVSVILNEMAAVVPTSFNEGNITIVAEMILNEYWDIKIEELVLSVHRGVKGVYGKIYHAVNFQTICGWIDEVYKERQLLLESNRTQAQAKDPHAERTDEYTDVRQLIKPLMDGNRKAMSEYLTKKLTKNQS